MITAGLDVGSRTIKLVLFADGHIVHSAVADSGLKPLDRCRRLLDGRSFDKLTVTGYGRDLVAPELSGATISEISAQAAAARFLYPDVSSVIDIGGQDSKVIRLSPTGVQKFEMNDRCAAGTGKFLEIMARALELSIDEFAKTALGAGRSVTLNSLCTVFAESEVVSLINKGEDAHAIALGLHQAVASRIGSMAKRVGMADRLIFSGGGAKNPCLVRLLEEKLSLKITVPEGPQTTAALGAAIIASLQPPSPPTGEGPR
ncbi:acyl-CoA dehydratase activase [Dehalogenimonas alkenigignens]|uniref:CoA-substrate-specific enzyme activase, putative n=1 Tax=Dehalogenimonas alkenigignens TaxID=1217799 RepID=A0A0W0GHG2_9CHLR|nr:acyl-CoA dehydratase activase [Dehalogenimonas alkenigignens]KTB48000.1 CoA-substrate-specific enzyme activase, putative [Dehalogenimonas alkenigignens]PVV84259.1 3-hydroxyacyl-ACP dehydratase [Dehalogenimonas alkenigignens]